jgi:adenosylcobinamide-GDP ribazoletransferase
MLLAKAAALVELAAFGPAAVAAALLAAHPLSRLASTSLIHTLDYVRDDDSSKSKPLAHRLTAHELALAALFGLLPLVVLPLVVLPIPAALAALVLATLATLWAARIFVHRIGGYTGDCLGALQQGSELACYLGILIAWNFT